MCTAAGIIAWVEAAEHATNDYVWPIAIRHLGLGTWGEKLRLLVRLATRVTIVAHSNTFEASCLPEDGEAPEAPLHDDGGSDSGSTDAGSFFYFGAGWKTIGHEFGEHDIK